MQYRIETVKSFNQTLRWKDGLMNDVFFLFFSTVFHSYPDDEWMIMKACVQWDPIYDWKDPRLC